MKARFIQDGKSVDFIPATDVAAGTVVIRGDMVGITKLDIKAETLGALAIGGVFDIEKTGFAIPLGGKVYWDTYQNKASGSGGVHIGVAILDAAADDETVRVQLFPIGYYRPEIPVESRYQYGEVNVVEPLVPRDLAIAQGDLIYQESGYAKPASNQTNQTTKALNQSTFASNFLGVALDAKPKQYSHESDYDIERTIRVATTGVFKFSCNPTTFQIGTIMGIEELPGRAGLYDQKIATALSAGGIGRIVRREPIETDAVLITIKSKVIDASLG